MFHQNLLTLLLLLLPMLLTISSNLEEWITQVEDIFGNHVSIIHNLFGTINGFIDFLWENFNYVVNEELDDMTPNNGDTFDFIIVGAGSAGATIAARLSEVKNITVLLIEAGDKENSFLDIPALASYLQLINKINWGYTVESSRRYCRGMVNRRCSMPRGKVMGGSSVLNFMTETHGNRRDYDQWEKLGCVGWSYKDVLPIFKKMENFDVHDSTIESAYHGTGGPVNVEKARYKSIITDAFIKAGIELGYPEVDYDGKNQIGYSYVHATLKNGSRCSSNRAYLHPIKGRSNLFLSRNSLVEKVLINDVTKSAYGVQFKKLGRIIQVLAKREVIVSGGAINSPQLLMLSGIGPANHLSKHRIPLLKDAPVGQNLMDHTAYFGLNFLVNDTVTLVFKKYFDLNNSAIGDYLNKREGPLTIAGGLHALNFIDVDNPKSRNGIPNLEMMFVPSAFSTNSIFYAGLHIDSKYYAASFANLKNRESFSIVTILLSPKSRGNILLRSKNPDDKPLLNFNYFSHPDDMRRMILGVREAVRISETQALQKYNAMLSNNSVPGCDHFKAGSDVYWDCCIRTYASTLYHPSGTCKMGARNDTSAVVDPRLRVIGINGLRVADASIMPTIITGHTNVPSMMIGEKLSEMVKEDWMLT